MNHINKFNEFNKINEEMAAPREHKWTKDDAILTLYYVKFGTEHIPVHNKKELAEWIIGSTENSLNMQAANIRFLLGYDPDDNYILSDYSSDQEWAVNKFGELDRGQLEPIVDKIITKRDVAQNKKMAILKSKEKDKKEITKKHQAASQQSLEDALRRMGKDPSKFRSIGKRKQ